VPRLPLLFFGEAKDIPEAAETVTAGTAYRQSLTALEGPKSQTAKIARERQVRRCRVTPPCLQVVRRCVQRLIQMVPRFEIAFDLSALARGAQTDTGRPNRNR